MTYHDDTVECERCAGTGEVSGSYGGDGYGDRCCGIVDYEGPCPDCRGEGVLIGYTGNGDHYEPVPIPPTAKGNP